MDWLTAILLLICPYYVSNSGGLIINPDVTAITGESANFTCSKQAPASYPVDWYHRSVGHESIIHIYSERGGGFRPEYKSNFVAVNDNHKGIYHLVIENVTTSLAGTFFCRDNDEYGTTAESNLIVIGHPPTCQINGEVFIGDNDCDITPDMIDLTCDVPYIGNRPPRLTWKYRNGTDFNQPALNLNRTVPMKATLSADTVRDGESFVCQVDSTSHQCTTDDIKIPQMKSRIVHTQKDFICSESPTTRHCNDFQLSNGTSRSDPALRICSANCTIRNISCPVPLLRLLSEQDAKKSIIIGIVVGLGCCFLISLAIGVFAHRKKVLCFKPRPGTNMAIRTTGTSKNDNAATNSPTRCRDIQTTQELREKKQGNVKKIIDEISKREQANACTSGKRRVEKDSMNQAKNSEVSLETSHQGDLTSDAVLSTEKHCGGISLRGEDLDPVADNDLKQPPLSTGDESQPMDDELPSDDEGASEDGQDCDPVAVNESGQPLLPPGDDPHTVDKELISNDKGAHDDHREDRDPEAADDSMHPLLSNGDDK